MYLAEGAYVGACNDYVTQKGGGRCLDLLMHLQTLRMAQNSNRFLIPLPLQKFQLPMGVYLMLTGLKLSCRWKVAEAWHKSHQVVCIFIPCPQTFKIHGKRFSK